MAKKKNSILKKIITGILIILVLIVSILGFIIIRLNQHINSDNSVIVNIEKNQSVDSILKTLNSKKVLTPSFIMNPAMKIYIKLTKRKVYAGSYKFAPESTNWEVLSAIIRGEANNEVKVTFPEGITLRDFAKILNKSININENEFIKLANSDSILKAKNIPVKNIEGYLYPATYTFAGNENPEQVLSILLDEQDKMWDSDNFKERLLLTGKTKHEILTLASIIEAETPVTEERRRIAGVYINRLKIGMKLEADPTVQYATGNKGRISYADLEVKDKYNTYRNYGLPPGPINNPSKASVDAALSPEAHNYLFFVAIGDGSGRHNFSTNFTQHKRYVSEYRANRRR